MSTTGLQVFDKTIHTTNVWLDEIMEEMGPDRQLAWHVLGAVLRAMRDRIPPDLAAHLGAQLPLMVRGAFYDQYVPSTMPDRSRSLEEFLDKIGKELQFNRPVNTKEALAVVGKVLSNHVDEGQIAKVWESLPEDIRAIGKSDRSQMH